MTQILLADLANAKHQAAIIDLLDMYCRDQFGDGKPLSEFVRANLIPGLVNHGGARGPCPNPNGRRRKPRCAGRCPGWPGRSSSARRAAAPPGPAAAAGPGRASRPAWRNRSGGSTQIPLQTFWRIAATASRSFAVAGRANRAGWATAPVAAAPLSRGSAMPWAWPEGAGLQYLVMARR